MQRRDIIAIAFLGLLISAVAILGAHYGSRPPPNRFGPEWDCIVHPYADVCIKRVRP